MRKLVYVYDGEGAGQRSVYSAVEAFEASLEGAEVQLLGAEQLLEGSWQDDCMLLCMPGGADLPYCRVLNGRGNAVIRGYVESGGAYLGLCAGAYYACSRIEFELGTSLEVKGPRELAFFPGLARGAVYPGFAYQTEAGARASPLRCKAALDSEDWTDCDDYSNGGPTFQSEVGAQRNQRISVLAEYADGNGPAAVRCQVGKGVAVLCATHPELAPSWLDGACNPAVLAEAHPELTREQIAELVKTARQVQSALREAGSQRQRFWRVLLSEAGL